MNTMHKKSHKKLYDLGSLFLGFLSVIALLVHPFVKNTNNTVSQYADESPRKERVYQILTKSESVPLEGIENTTSLSEEENGESETLTSDASPSQDVVEEAPRIPPSSTIFKGTLGDGWSFITQSGSSKIVGSAIDFSPHEPWDRVTFSPRAFWDSAKYETITLQFSIETDNTHELYLTFTDESYAPRTYVRVSEYAPGRTLTAGKSITVSIPLKDLGASNQTLNELVLESADKQRLTLIGIELSTLYKTTYSPEIVVEAPAPEEEDATQEDLPAPIVPVTSDPFIFTNAFVGEWKQSEDSWAVEVSPVTSPLISGTHALMLTYTAKWGTFIITHPGGFDTKGKQYLTLGAHGGTNGNQKIYVIAYDQDGKELGITTLLDEDIDERLLARTWKNVRVPLRKLNPTGEIIGSFAFQVQESTSPLYIDDIQISN